MKRLTNPTTYEVSTNRARYAVVMERLNNTPAGAPRFKAQLITLQVFGEEPPTGDFYTVAYTFKGHYDTERNEAQYIVEAHEAR